MKDIHKIIVINTKGGVGKSTICSQIIAPYFFLNSKKEYMIYEFDDENSESKYFGGSSVVKSTQIAVGQSNLRGEITELLLNPLAACIDVGANKTAKIFADALLDSGMIYKVDLVIIPLMDGELDASSAFDMYCQLKSGNPSLKIIFALGKANTSRDLMCQFDMFFGDQRDLFNNEGIYSWLKEGDKNYITIADSDVIKYSRLFGVTVWEIADNERNTDNELKEAIVSGADEKTIRLLSFKRSLQSDCKLYVKEVLEPSFETIKSCLDMRLA